VGADHAVPEFVRGSALLETAFEFADRSHHGPARTGDTDISHPVAVARLLSDADFDEDVVAAALLHDVVEDTSHVQGDILDRFRERVAGLVEVMTEDDSIEPYGERKAEHRTRVLEAGRIPASIYLADKLARIRAYRGRGQPVAAARLEHYRRTLDMFGRSGLELPFLEQIGAELPYLRADPDAAP
jgi:(p)ppGpp synthase/HD superfamily hydrolase